MDADRRYRTILLKNEILEKLCMFDVLLDNNGLTLNVCKGKGRRSLYQMSSYIAMDKGQP